MCIFETQWNLDLTVQFAEWTLFLMNVHEISNYIISGDLTIWANNVYCHKWCNTYWKLQASFRWSWMENSCPLIWRKSREKLTHCIWSPLNRYSLNWGFTVFLENTTFFHNWAQSVQENPIFHSWDNKMSISSRESSSGFQSNFLICIWLKDIPILLWGYLLKKSGESFCYFGNYLVSLFC